MNNEYLKIKKKNHLKFVFYLLNWEKFISPLIYSGMWDDNSPSSYYQTTDCII